MFSRILVLTDLAAESAELARCAAGLASLGVQEAHLVYCLPMDKLPGLRESMESLIGDDLEKARRQLAAGGWPVTSEVAVGPLGAEIERIAAEKDCSLVVVGSRVRSLAGDVLFGGVAAEAIYSARRPTLVIRIHADEGGVSKCRAWPCGPMERVLFPTDFSDNAEHAFGFLERLVTAGVRRVALLHVQDRARLGKHLEHRLAEFNATDQARLGRLKERLLKLGAEDVSIEVPYGHPAGEALAAAQRPDTSLVVMGSQGRGFLSEVFVGSVSHHMARRSAAPVLLIPAIR
ncbi:MAG TPA: universal stress protein [Candidatus Brocadiia bacterium]|nr:universal stress protein [Candidatus Brocadiia bacterium]